PPAVLGTMPSVYQLLPRPRHGPLVDAADRSHRVDDFMDAKLWEQYGWGLASPKQDGVLQQLLPDGSSAADRRRIALDHLTKCLNRARQFHAALDVPASPPPGVDLYLFAGDAVQTASVAAVDTKTGDLKIISTAPGDGTVLRTSALMDERLAGNWT